MVTESELRTLLESRGWYLSMVRKFHNRFAYAKRREGKAVKTRYLIAEKKFGELTEQEVLRRISK